MKIIVLNESVTQDPLFPVEKRCAVTPASVGRLVKKGVTIQLESGAGALSGYTDKEYEEAGAVIINDVNVVLSSADMLVACLLYTSPSPRDRG